MIYEQTGAALPLVWRKRLEELRQAVAQRLRPVCGNMPADEFNQIVDKIASIELRYDYRGGTWRSRGE